MSPASVEAAYATCTVLPLAALRLITKSTLPSASFDSPSATDTLGASSLSVIVTIVAEDASDIACSRKGERCSRKRKNSSGSTSRSPTMGSDRVAVCVNTGLPWPSAVSRPGFPGTESHLVGQPSVVFRAVRRAVQRRIRSMPQIGGFDRRLTVVVATTGTSRVPMSSRTSAGTSKTTLTGGRSLSLSTIVNGTDAGVPSDAFTGSSASP